MGPRERLAQTREQAHPARASARTALAEAYQRLTEAHATAEALAADVLPGVRRSVADALAGFRRGGARSVDVSQGRVVLIGADREQLDALERLPVGQRRKCISRNRRA